MHSSSHAPVGGDGEDDDADEGPPALSPSNFDLRKASPNAFAQPLTVVQHTPARVELPKVMSPTQQLWQFCVFRSIRLLFHPI
jgi:hypothetical protein